MGKEREEESERVGESFLSINISEDAEPKQITSIK